MKEYRLKVNEIKYSIAKRILLDVELDMDDLWEDRICYLISILEDETVSVVDTNGNEYRVLKNTVQRLDYVKNNKVQTSFVFNAAFLPISTIEDLNLYFSSTKELTVQIDWTAELETAVELAFWTYNGHRGRMCESSIIHPLNLMGKVPSSDEKIVAILYKIVEYSIYSLEELRKVGISDRNIEVLSLLVHDEGVPINIHKYFSNLKELIIKSS